MMQFGKNLTRLVPMIQLVSGKLRRIKTAVMYYGGGATTADSDQGLRLSGNYPRLRDISSAAGRYVALLRSMSCSQYGYVLY